MAQATTAPETTRTALLRAFNPASGDHFYTTSAAEHDNAVAKLGYFDEEVACYVFSAAGPNTTPLLRMFNPASADHFYTTSTAEHDNAVAAYGYVSEGIAGHVYPEPAPQPTPATGTATTPATAAATTPAPKATTPAPKATTPAPNKKDEIEVEGKIIEVLPNAMFRVEIDENHQVLAVLSGRIRANFIRMVVGDKVRVVLSPYDLTRGRITWRAK